MWVPSSKDRVCPSTSCEVIEEMFQMWMEILEKLVESFACMNPVGYAYYLAAKQEPIRPTPTAQDEADEKELVRLIDRLQARREPSA
jgi:hypothetical protein